MVTYVKVDGGIGRCIAATGALRELAKTKTVSVVTSFPFCFDHLEFLDRVYPLGTPFIYEDHLAKGEFFEPEPYNHRAYYADEQHLATVFNGLMTGKFEYTAPVLNMSANELEAAKQMIDGLRKETGKGVVLVQPWGSSGGRPTGREKVNDDETFRSFTYEFTKELCDALNKAKLTPLIVKSQDQAGYENSKQVTGANPRAVFAMIPHVDGVICCDSFLHHASAALGTPVPTVVLWAGTSEKNLGYEAQTNIVTKKPRLVEPNRIPHDHAYYVTKNKGINDFPADVVPDIVAKMLNNVSAEAPKA